MGAVGTTRVRKRQTKPRLHLLGSFGVHLGHGRPSLPLITQRLVAYLAIHRDVSRSRAAGALWPEVEEARAHANLRTALWRLRAGSIDLVDACSSGVRLADDVVIDLRRGEDVAYGILDGSLAPTEGFAAVELLSADLLPDWEEEWLVFERARYSELRAHALETLCERLTADGEHALAVESGMLAVQAEPLRESAHRSVMRAYLAEGNPAMAMHQLRVLEERLGEELQVEPSLATLELAMEVADAGPSVAPVP